MEPRRVHLVQAINSIGQLLVLSCLLLTVATNGQNSFQQQAVGSKASASFAPETIQRGNDALDGGEQVDRLALASGDAYWRPRQIEWVRETLGKLLQRLQRPTYLSTNNDDDQQQQQPLYLDQPLSSAGGRYDQVRGMKRAGRQQYAADTMLNGGLYEENCHLCTYQSLVDEYKQLSRAAANPSRENRAFKPKLMSTARGFGKRSGSAHHITYDNLAPAA